MMQHQSNSIHSADGGGSINFSLNESHIINFSVTQNEDKLKEQEQASVTYSCDDDQHIRDNQVEVSQPESASVDVLPNTTPLSEELNPSKKKSKKKKKKTKSSTSLLQDGLETDLDDPLKSSMCSVCQEVFAHFPDLLAHRKAVHGADTNHPFRCSACGRIQTSETGLKYHQTYVCKMVERPHSCEICLLNFQTEEMVKTHKCSGCHIRKFACESCDHYRTESFRDLEKHMRIHTNDKCYVCRVCEFSTVWKKNLKDHMMKHLGLKPFVCDLCEYSTSDRHSLRAHKLKHSLKGDVGSGDCYTQSSTVKRRKVSSGGIVENSSSDAPAVSGQEFECPRDGVSSIKESLSLG